MNLLIASYGGRQRPLPTCQRAFTCYAKDRSKGSKSKYIYVKEVLLFQIKMPKSFYVKNVSEGWHLLNLIWPIMADQNIANKISFFWNFSPIVRDSNQEPRKLGRFIKQKKNYLSNNALVNGMRPKDSYFHCVAGLFFNIWPFTSLKSAKVGWFKILPTTKLTHTRHRPLVISYSLMEYYQLYWKDENKLKRGPERDSVKNYLRCLCLNPIPG